MARSEGDTWDLANSVGATATMVAAARAAATRRAIITDEFAEPLVRAAGLDLSPSWRPANWIPPTSKRGSGFRGSSTPSPRGRCFMTTISPRPGRPACARS